MNRATRVVIDSLRGEALLGETVVAIADAGSSGELQVGGVRGPILRPLTFGERTRAVSRAALSPLPRENVCAGILDMATVQPGAANRAIQEILALILAGGDQEQAPSFAETVLLVARGTGWGPAQLADTPAAEIDRIAIHLGGRQRESSWNRLLLASSPADELASIRDDLADDLLKRVDIAPQAAEAGRDLAKTETFEHPIHSTDPSSNTGFASATTQPNHSNLAADASRVYTHMQNTIGANSELESDAAATEFEPEVLETTLSPQTSSLADSGRKTALLGKKPRHLPSSDLEGTAAPGKSSQCPLPPDNNRPVHFRIHNRVNPPSLPKTATSKPADAQSAPVQLVRLDNIEILPPTPSNGISFSTAQNPYPHPNPAQRTDAQYDTKAATSSSAVTRGNNPSKAEGKPESKPPATAIPPSPAASGDSLPETMGRLGSKHAVDASVTSTMISSPPIIPRQSGVAATIPPAIPRGSNAVPTPPPTLDNCSPHKIAGTPASEQQGMAVPLAADLSSLHHLAEPLPREGDSLFELADALATLLHDEADMRGIAR